MSTQDHITGDLPDDVYGSADANPSNLKRLRVTVTTHDKTGSVLLHAHIGGIYLAMSERNWRGLFKAITSLEIEVKPVTHKIIFDDAKGEAWIETAV